MNKIKPIIGIILLTMIFGLVACKKNEVINDDLSGDANNQQQEIVESIDVLNMTFEERTAELFNWQEKKKNLQYKEYYYDNVIENISLEKVENYYLLRADVLHPVTFTKAQIDAVVNEMENNKLETAKLGDYTVYRTLPSDAYGKVYEEISNGNWLSENGNPCFIKSNQEDWGMWVNLEKKDDSEDEYVLYYYAMAGAFEKFIELSDETSDKIEIKLLSNDKIAVLEGGSPIYREEPYEVLTVQEYYDRALIGDTTNESVRYNINDMSETTLYDDELTLENGVICIYQVNGGI